MRSFSLQAQRKAAPKVYLAKKASVNFRNCGIECDHHSVPAAIMEAPVAQTKNSKTWKNFPNFDNICRVLEFFAKDLNFFPKPLFLFPSCSSATLQKGGVFCSKEGLYASAGESRERAWL